MYASLAVKRREGHIAQRLAKEPKASLQPDAGSNGHFNSTSVELKAKTRARNQAQARHKRTITAQAPAPKASLLMHQAGGGSVGEEDVVTHDAAEYRNREEAFNDFFKDGDDELFQD